MVSVGWGFRADDGRMVESAIRLLNVMRFRKDPDFLAITMQEKIARPASLLFADRLS